MNETYRKQVALLIRVMPYIARIKDFAVHGGTAINLFHRNMERYSVDIDITYIPLEERDKSLANINRHLLEVKKMIERAIPGIKVVHKPDVWKLQCTKGGVMVKIEVNGTKRGIIGHVEQRELCDKAKAEFGLNCVANIVSWSQLYGGKVVAALSRQHPRDMFDCRNLSPQEFDAVKDGFMLCLLGSDKPLVESLNPHKIDHSEALQQQFAGMTDIPFEYADYEKSRRNLINIVNGALTETDRNFLVSFEAGAPDWEKCCIGNLAEYPSVKWKLQNIANLKQSNPMKFQEGVEKLRKYLV